MKNLLKKGCIPLAIVLVISLLGGFTGCSGGTVSTQDTLELNLAHFWSSTHPVEVELVQPWIAAVREATEGRVKITSYPGETLIPSAEIYEGVKEGVADMGLSCFSYTRGQFPVLEVFELPGIVYNDSVAATKIAWEGIRELNPKEVQDTTLMMVFTTGPGHLFTRNPVKNLNDLKGLEIRATGLSAATLQALGATPVAMPQAEAYEALSKGVVKGNLGPTEILKGWNQAEVTKYITMTPFLYNTLFFFTMNTGKWDKISEEDQKAIQGINQKFFDEVACGLWDKQNEDAYSYAVNEKGMEVFELSDDEMAAWTDLVKPVQDDFVSKMDSQGFNGREILDTVQGLSDKYK
ncbi:MAG: TRAP transporter substrate-binding protein [Oscillospiraceae bacterium]|nr:TRAP transporter substrate-binding protein [Oscillospiraceae bacterium]